MNSINRSEGFQSSDCERYWQIVESEALGEYRALPEDGGFIEEHLRSCPDCVAFQAVLRGFGVTPPREATDAALVRRVNEDYYRRLAARRRRARQVAWVSAGVLSAAAAVLLVLVVGLIKEKPKALPRPDRSLAAATDNVMPLEVVYGTLRIDGAEASEGAVLAEGASIVTNGKDTFLKSRGSVFSLGIDAKTEIAVRQLRGDRVSLDLKQGLVAVDLAKDQNVRFTVDTRSARVTVTGTMFSVESAVDDVTVRVVRGSVRVESPAWPEKAIDVKAGWSLAVGEKELVPLKSMPKYTIFSLLRLTAEAPVQDSAAREENGSATKEAGRDLTHAGDARASRSMRRNRAGSGALAQREEALSPGDLIRAARVCRRSRDWQCAISAYSRVAEQYPATPEAATVLLPLADIELENLGQPREALEHYNAYYSKHPNGPLAQEALYGKCRALGALGQTDREKAALEWFVEMYPQSLYAPNATARLQEISR